MLGSGFYYHSHCKDEETEAWRLSILIKITQQVRVRADIPMRASLTTKSVLNQSYSFCSRCYYGPPLLCTLWQVSFSSLRERAGPLGNTADPPLSFKTNLYFIQHHSHYDSGEDRAGCDQFVEFHQAVHIRSALWQVYHISI